MDMVLSILGQVCAWLFFACIGLEVLAFVCRVYVKAFPKRNRESGLIVSSRWAGNHFTRLINDVLSVRRRPIKGTSSIKRATQEQQEDAGVGV